MKNGKNMLLLVFASFIGFQIEATRNEETVLQTMREYITIPDSYYLELLKLADAKQRDSMKASVKVPLFEQFPALREKLAYVELGEFPMPVEKLEKLSSNLGIKNLYVKRDDLSGGFQGDGSRLFGGNKVRKLEFLLADAISNNAKTIMTFGCAGSNHVVATVAYAQKLGLDCIAMLKPQPSAPVVQRNLLLMDYYGAEIQLCPTNELRNLGTIYTFLRRKLDDGSYPYFIPTGGSCPRGVVGFVNAALELKQQIQEGLMPEPDYIYVAAGSMGTMVGLLLGIKAAGLKTKVIGVTVQPEGPKEFNKGIAKLFDTTNTFLNSLDSSFPLFTLSKNDFVVNFDFCGKEYGLITPESADAIDLMSDEDVTLDGIYSGKAFAALMHDAKNYCADEVILFWDTFCGENFDDVIAMRDYKKLPIGLHTYFDN